MNFLVFDRRFCKTWCGLFHFEVLCTMCMHVVTLLGCCCIIDFIYAIEISIPLSQGKMQKSFSYSSCVLLFLNPLPPGFIPLSLWLTTLITLLSLICISIHKPPSIRDGDALSVHHKINIL